MLEPLPSHRFNLELYVSLALKPITILLIKKQMLLSDSVV